MRKFILFTAVITAVLACIFATLNLIPVVGKANTVYLYALSAISIVALLGFAINYILSITDTESFEELEAQRDKYYMQEKMASLGQMIAGVAHEINTPLSYVSNNVELMNRCIQGVRDDVIQPIETLRQKDTKSLADILKNQRHIITAVLDNKYPKKTHRAADLGDDAEVGLKNISKLVENLKNFSRVDRKEKDYADIHELIEISLKVADRHIEKNHVIVRKEFDNNLPLLHCQPSKLNQVFLNAIINACQAIIGGGQLIIKTQYDTSNRNILVDFVDDGMGMSRKTQRAIFDPFYTTKEVGSGAGLGMSIVSSIIKEHNGEINLDSSLGNGTRISFSLPHQPMRALQDEGQL